MASNALATAPKSVQTQAQSLARSAAAKAKKAVQHAQRIKAPMLATAGGAALGLAERFAGPDVSLPGIDNGFTVGIPTVVVGAFAPGALGEWLMLMGSGMLASGARAMARDAGSDGDTEGL